MGKHLNVAHVILNNLGGITTLVQNLILYKSQDAFPQHLFVLEIEGNKNAKANGLIDARLNYDKIYFNPKNNWYHAFSKMASRLSENYGILISNDQYELIMLQAFNIPRKVVQLVHDEYNLSLSLKYQNCIDCFVFHNLHLFNKFSSILSHRRNDIHYLPYGIPNIGIRNLKIHHNLKLLFIGRHDKQKGILDLIEIENILQKNNVHVDWTILGKGPESEAVKLQWVNKKNVLFYFAKNNDEVLSIASSNDILVFPTRFEGSPVAMLEAMSVGCVPIVTALEGGITETIEDGINGFLCEIDNISLFAERIMFLSKNHERLEIMKQNAINTIIKKFNPHVNFELYHSLFAEILNDNKKPLHHSVSLKIGSRLDSRYIPNWVTSIIRQMVSTYA